MNAPDLFEAEPRQAPAPGHQAPRNDFYDALNGLERPTRPGPVPDPAVFQGLVGRTVRELDPTTEADPVGVLVNLLSAAGAQMGADPHLRIGNDRHPALIWALTIGATAAGRKGAATNTARLLLAAAAPGFAKDNLLSGLSSGEGLIEAVRDGDPTKKDDPGHIDKRRWIVESEYGITMARARREGSSLGGVLRQAWNGEDLGVMNREALKVTAPHIAIIGHISPRELRAKMQDSEMAGGTYNRYLPIFVHRNLILAESRGADPQLVDNLAATWRTALSDARQAGEVTLAEPARKLWREDVYPALCGDEDGDGPLAEFTARAAPYTLRLAMVYALLDHHRQIQEDHLRAAHALVNYSRASAAHVLGMGADTTGDPKLDKLAAAVRAAGPRGLTGEEVYKLFKRNSKDERSRLVAALLQIDGYGSAQIPGSGRHATVLLYAPPTD
ncbi:DUF3987 domain-containing protein [Kitasatospora sp. NPDC086009]|uniref:DUF3987 domain-containing protein n=1 Tax=unclassified Kitasatospora TaxID=2633591 RepID=UPI0037CC7536